MSPDLEDLVRALAGSVGLLEEVGGGQQDVHEVVRAGLAHLLARPGFIDALPAYFEGDAATQPNVGPFVTLMRQAAHGAP